MVETCHGASLQQKQYQTHKQFIIHLKFFTIMRKIRHFFLTAAAVLCSTLTTWAAYSGTPVAPTQINGNYADYGLSADYDGYYVISTAAELYGFAELVNGGTTTANAVLTANIEVNENVLNANGSLNGTPTYSWTPIGTSNYNYVGTFDGNGHTISGLYFNNTTNSDYPNGGNYVGLIGYANKISYANKVTIKNVGVIDSYLKGYEHVGGICGFGTNTNTNITNCYNTGTVSGSERVGGICGYSGNPTNCYNTGTVSGNSEVGGICGYGGTQNNCHNTGTVSGSYNYNYVGGICGKYGTQNNCHNTGTVSGSIDVGGICGGYGTQNNCYNIGTVSGSERVGGICGEYGTQNNCYYLAGCGSKNTLGVSTTAEEFASGKITYLLNGSTSEGDLTWYQTLGVDGDAYPLLDNTHGVVYATHPCTSGFSNTTEGEGAIIEHPSMDDVTGRCTACGQFSVQATLVTESNYNSLNLTADFVDYYAISNSAELYWFANEVNNGNTTIINAVLTADIVVNEKVLKEDGTLNGTHTYTWTPIGTSSYKYTGTFDGNSHIVSGLYFDNPDGGNYVGLIGYADEATIKNVGVIDSYLKGYKYIGGICGYSSNANTNISNCYNTGTVLSSSTVGGICGYSGTQNNCYNTGTVSGSYDVGGICGWSGTQNNCYYLAGCGSQNTRGFSVTAEDVASGRLTYLLNGSTSGNDNAWRQTLGNSGDAYPVLDNTHSVVFITQPCISFSNDVNNTHKEHPSTDAIGYCTACGRYTTQGALVTESNYSGLNLTADFVDYYAISNTAELYWFADEVNHGNTTINAVLTADIFVNENVLNADGTLNGTPTYSWTPIGTSSYKYAGTFDGNGHTISGLYFNNTTDSNYPNGGNYVGLIGYANGATIKNVGVINFYLKGNKYVGGICGYYGTQTNCHNTGTVSGSRYVGGICGNGGTQTNCHNTGTVSGTNYVGGICGSGNTQTNCYNTGTISGSQYVGGICGAFSTITNCHNTGTVSGSYNYVGGICGNCQGSGLPTNCYYLAGCAKGCYNVEQYGVGNATSGQTTADVEDKTTPATLAEFASGRIAYLLNGGTFEETTWRQTLFADASPVLDTEHNIVTGYVTEAENVITIIGDLVVATDYEIAEGKTLTVPEGASLTISKGASLTTIGEAIITNSGTIVCNGTITGNDLAGDGSFYYTLLADADVTLNTDSYTYRGTAYTIEDGIDFSYATHTLCGKDFAYNGTFMVSYNNNINAGNATVSLTNNTDNENVVSKPFTILAKEIGLAWGESTFTYNGTEQAPTATATGLIEGDACTVTVSGAQTNAGTAYTATASAVSNTNYALPTAKTKAFIINPKDVELVWENTTLTYNGSAQKPTATATGMANGEELAVTVSGEQTNAGTYTATASITDNNYKLPEVVTKEFTIGKATPTYTTPENLAILCNQTLADVVLPEGFAFENLNAELTEGENTLTVKFTPENTANYKVVKGIEVKVANAVHTAVPDAAVPATCTESGLTEGSHCSICNEVLVAQEVIPAGHKADSVQFENVVAATCTVAGSKDSVVYCSVCKAELSRTKIEILAAGHKADSVQFENIVAATCTVAGSKDSVVYCTVCKAELSRTKIEIPATGHKADSIQFENVVAATCTVAGSKDSVVYCSVCGVEVSRTKIEIPATGHTVVVDSAVAATATETGLTEGSHCSVCGETIVAQDVIPATGEQGGEGNGSEGGNENQGGNENTEPATAVAESAAQQVSIYSHHNIIVVENADAEIFVYNIMGNLVATTNDANAEIVINTTGVYIVKVGGTSKRVMINN